MSCFGIFESKDVFEMIANLYVYLGLGREELRVLLDRIAEQYFMLARFSQGYNLCTQPLKIKFFVREVLDQIIKVPQVANLSRTVNLSATTWDFARSRCSSIEPLCFSSHAPCR